MNIKAFKYGCRFTEEKYSSIKDILPKKININ